MKEDKTTESINIMGCNVCWGHQSVWHMVVRIFIILFVFWAGAEFGELKATLKSQYQNPSFMIGGEMNGWNDGYSRGYPHMMGSYQVMQTPVALPAAVATPTTPTTKK